MIYIEESDHKRKLTLKLNVISASREEFSKNFHSQKDIFKKFMLESLALFGIHNPDCAPLLNELVANAYDSFSKDGVNIGDVFILKLVIKEKEGRVILNVMDNGFGFSGQPKSDSFERDKISVIFKDEDVGFIGGQGIGLSMMETILKQNNNMLLFKNRKDKGATVGIHFNSENSGFKPYQRS